MKESIPLIIQYTNLLHKYKSPHVKEVKDFKVEHESDKVFRQRADVLDRMWVLKQLLV